MGFREALQPPPDTEKILEDRNRRAHLNVRLGMSHHCPYAFQLSQEELEAAEIALQDGAPLLPIWTNQDGLRLLEDPVKAALRRKNGRPRFATSRERLAYYAANAGAPESPIVPPPETGGASPADHPGDAPHRGEVT